MSHCSYIARICHRGCTHVAPLLLSTWRQAPSMALVSSVVETVQASSAGSWGTGGSSLVGGSWLPSFALPNIQGLCLDEGTRSWKTSILLASFWGDSGWYNLIQNRWYDDMVHPCVHYRIGPYNDRQWVSSRAYRYRPRRTCLPRNAFNMSREYTFHH